MISFPLFCLNGSISPDLLPGLTSGQRSGVMQTGSMSRSQTSWITETLYQGNLVSHSDEEYVCDSGNFEILLRLNRLESRPAFEALDIRELPLFVAAFQGIAKAGTGLGDS